VALKGPVTTPIGEGFTSVNVGLRKALDLYANLRPVWSIPGFPSRYSGIDLVIVRENTEDLYSGLEHEVVPGVVESLKIISERASRRIVEFAFKYARERGRRKVTAVHKANIMKLGDGLFLRTARDVARQHTDITYDEKIVDATCMHLVMRPEAFDVLVMPNLYGDIVSISAPASSAAWASCPARTWAQRRPCSRPSTAARRHRRQEHGEPDGAAALRAADAGTHRRGRGCRPDPIRDLRGPRRRESANARHGRQREHDGVHGGGLRRDRTEGVRTDVPREMPLDEVMRAVLARDEVVAYLNGSHGESGPKAAARVHAYLDELRTRQRYPIYRALKHPLYPILRKLTRITEHPEIIRSATSKARVVYVSNHRSHLDYLLEPLVLEDESIRPPVIAAGINLFGGPLGLIHRHVTGAIPIRRNMKDPAYLITLKAYVAEILQRHDLLFYIEGGRSYSGELKAPKTGLLHAALQAEVPNLLFVPCAVAYDLVLEDHILARQQVKRKQRPSRAS
jgi:hypothetical protein